MCARGTHPLYLCRLPGHFRPAFLEGGDFTGCDFADAILGDADLSWAGFRDATLNRADFRPAVVNGATFEHANVAGADFTGVDWSQVDAAHIPPGLFRPKAA